MEIESKIRNLLLLSIARCVFYSSCSPPISQIPTATIPSPLSLPAKWTPTATAPPIDLPTITSTEMSTEEEGVILNKIVHKIENYITNVDNIVSMAYIDKVKSGKKTFYYLGKTIRVGPNKWKKIRIKLGILKPSKELIAKKLKELK